METQTEKLLLATDVGGSRSSTYTACLLDDCHSRLSLSKLWLLPPKVSSTITTTTIITIITTSIITIIINITFIIITVITVSSGRSTIITSTIIIVNPAPGLYQSPLYLGLSQNSSGTWVGGPPLLSAFSPSPEPPSHLWGFFFKIKHEESVQRAGGFYPQSH